MRSTSSGSPHGVGLVSSGLGIEVKDPDDASYWNSGSYRFDGAGNIIGIGDQEYSYFPSGSLHEAKVCPQAGDPDGVLHTLTFGYDPFGNMTFRRLDPADPKPEVPGLEFSGRSYDDGNHVTDTGFRYDAMGRTIRYPRQVDTAGSDPLVQAAMWSDGGQLTSFFQGEPKTGEAPAEQYLYGAGGLRLVRLPLGRDGKARISVRDVSGQTAAEYVDEPGSDGMTLSRELVYGFGRLLVERHPSTGSPTQSASSSLYGDGSYSLDLTDSAGGSTFDVDIQTTTGFRNQVPNIQPDGGGRYQISESDLSPGETNYLRIKSVAPEESPYSMPVSISYDPSIDGSSENQVRAVSVSRVGDNLVVRWSLHQDNGKAFQIYFHRADNDLTYVLSATALPSGTTEYTIASQDWSQSAAGSSCARAIFYRLSQAVYFRPHLARLDAWPSGGSSAGWGYHLPSGKQSDGPDVTVIGSEGGGGSWFTGFLDTWIPQGWIVSLSAVDFTPFTAGITGGLEWVYIFGEGWHSYAFIGGGLGVPGISGALETGPVWGISEGNDYTGFYWEQQGYLALLGLPFVAGAGLSGARSTWEGSPTAWKGGVGLGTSGAGGLFEYYREVNWRSLFRRRRQR